MSPVTNAILGKRDNAWQTRRSAFATPPFVAIATKGLANATLSIVASVTTSAKSCSCQMSRSVQLQVAQHVRSCKAVICKAMCISYCAQLRKTPRMPSVAIATVLAFATIAKTTVVQDVSLANGWIIRNVRILRNYNVLGFFQSHGTFYMPRIAIAIKATSQMRRTSQLQDKMQQLRIASIHDYIRRIRSYYLFHVLT